MPEFRATRKHRLSIDLFNSKTTILEGLNKVAHRTVVIINKDNRMFHKLKTL